MSLQKPLQKTHKVGVSRENKAKGHLIRRVCLPVCVCKGGVIFINYCYVVCSTCVYMGLLRMPCLPPTEERQACQVSCGCRVKCLMGIDIGQEALYKVKSIK